MPPGKAPTIVPCTRCGFLGGVVTEKGANVADIIAIGIVGMIVGNVAYRIWYDW
jgi:type IV secretory pathway VirB3-like protein